MSDKAPVLQFQYRNDKEWHDHDYYVLNVNNDNIVMVRIKPDFKPGYYQDPKDNSVFWHNEEPDGSYTDWKPVNVTTREV